MRSHNPEMKYLNSELTLRKMYMYVEKCDENNTFLSKQIYRNILKILIYAFITHTKIPVKI